MSSRAALQKTQIPLIGWREWVALPELGVHQIKAKIDTGARTSALHTVFQEVFKKNHRLWVRFLIFPHQKNNDTYSLCEKNIIDSRHVKTSDGKIEQRYVIKTHIWINHICWPIEVTLTDRTPMNFRLLLGRNAIKDHFVIDPSASFLAAAQQETES